MQDLHGGGSMSRFAAASMQSCDVHLGGASWDISKLTIGLNPLTASYLSGIRQLR